jgi:hypothetical protein
MMKLSVIHREKDDLIWCPESKTWVDKTTDSAHFYFIHLALKAMEDVPKEDNPEIVMMPFSDAVGTYFTDDNNTKEELAAFLKKHLG